MISRFMMCLFLLLAPALALGQPLVDRVPADAVVYIAWQGSDHLPAAYQQSHLKAVLDASNLREFASDFLPRVVQRIAAEEPQAGQILGLATAIAAPLGKHPTALYIGNMEFPQDGPPRPKMALLCQAGADADALLGRLQPLVNMAGQQLPFPLRAGKVGDLVVLSVGFNDPAAALAGGEVKALSTDPKFQQAMSQVQKDAVASVYADIEAILATVDRVSAMAGGPEGQAQWQRARDAFGLSRLRRLMFTGAFDGPDWATAGFLATAGPISGAAALSDDLLRTIPASSPWAAAGYFDLGAGFDTLRSIMTQLAPDVARDFDQGVARINQAAGLDLRRDVLGAFGAQWAVFTDPAAVGNGLTSFTLVNRPPDAAKAQASLTTLERTINQAIAGEMRGPVKVAVNQSRVGDLDLHTLGVPMVAPTWTIHNNTFYAGVYPHAIVSATEGGGSKGKTLLDNPAFIALRKRLGADKASGFLFADLTRTAPAAYEYLIPISQLGLGFAEMSGVTPPRLVLPPLNRLQPHLAAAADFNWQDDAGWHYRSVSPFPGSSLLAGDSNAAIGGGALGVSILLPALNAAKERANRVKCASNLRQIGMGCMLYANDNRGKLPPDLGALVTDTDLNPMVFVCPASGGPHPPAFADVKQAAQWVNQNAHYVYLGANMNANAFAAERILAHEKLENHDREGVNALFGDGHVEWMNLPMFQEQLRRQQQGR